MKLQSELFISWIEISVSNHPLRRKANDKSRVSTGQHPEPVPATKASKIKIDVEDQERNEAVSKNKKEKTHQERNSEVQTSTNFSILLDDEKSQLPTNTQQSSPLINVHYGINQTTARCLIMKQPVIFQIMNNHF